MHPFPRQTGASEAVPSSSVAATPTAVLASAANTASTSLDAQTSTLTSAGGSTSQQLSSSTGSASSSSAAPTTTSSSTATTPSTSPSSSNNDPSTTSNTTPSSSIVSQTTSSVSSSVSFPTSTQPPTSSSSQQQTTTITTAYTTYINGSQILTSTAFPSTIPVPSSLSSTSNRTAIIAGSAAGGTALIILILTFAFCVRRKRFKRVHFLDAITLKRKQARSRATLLDGEDLDPVGRPLHGYTDYETPWDGTQIPARRGLDTPAPTLPSRWAENGSMFREEVWPPPNEATRLMDPLANDIHVDLSRIVDDVMGPSHTRAHFSDQSVSSIHRGSVADSQGHSRTTSNASHAALLEAAGLSGSGLASTAPVRPSPLAHQEVMPPSVEGGNT